MSLQARLARVQRLFAASEPVGNAGQQTERWMDTADELRTAVQHATRSEREPGAAVSP